MENENKAKLSAIGVVLVISSVICSFAAYNAGLGDGKRQMLQAIAACTIKDAQTGRCFIPCAEEYDCYLKNGMKDH